MTVCSGFFPASEAAPDSHHKRLERCVYQGLYDPVDMEEMKGAAELFKKQIELLLKTAFVAQNLLTRTLILKAR